METPIALEPHRFRVALATAGYRSVAQLARSLSLSESYLRQIAHGLVPSVHVRQRISDALHVEASALWRPLDSKVGR